MSDNTNQAEVILEVQDLRKSFGDHEVLKGITTTIRKGDVLALIGSVRMWKIHFPALLKYARDTDRRTCLFEGMYDGCIGGHQSCPREDRNGLPAV